MNGNDIRGRKAKAPESGNLIRRNFLTDFDSPDPDTKYATLWPWATEKDGTKRWAASKAMQEAYRAILRGGEAALSGFDGTVDMNQMANAGADAAMTVAAGGRALSAAPGLRAPAGALGIFAGRRAKTADHAALKQAEELEAAGVRPAEIWTATGWGRGADGEWRFEIDDSGAKLQSVEAAGIPSERIVHEELDRAYPGMASQMSQYIVPGPKSHGQYFPSLNHLDVTGPTPEKRRQIGLHELQHRVQDTENFGFGAAPDLIPNEEVAEAVRRNIASARAIVDSELGATFPDLRRDASEFLSLAPADQEKSVRNALYSRTSGEVEARNVMGRADLTAAERRAIDPLSTEPVSRSSQIVRDRNFKKVPR